MKTFTFDLPFFPGFYDILLENSDMVYWAINEKVEYYHDELGRDDITGNDLDFDYRAYEKAVMDSFISAFKDHAPGIVVGVEFDELVSPRYYNFETDRLFCRVTFADGWAETMKAFMEENKVWLADRIHRQWSSRDGFISFMDNDIRDWYGRLFTEQNDTYIGVMLGYMMRLQDGRDVYQEVSDSIIDQTLEDIYEGSYVYEIAGREAA